MFASFAVLTLLLGVGESHFNFKESCVGDRVRVRGYEGQREGERDCWRGRREGRGRAGCHGKVSSSVRYTCAPCLCFTSFESRERDGFRVIAMSTTSVRSLNMQIFRAYEFAIAMQSQSLAHDNTHTSTRPALIRRGTSWTRTFYVDRFRIYEYLVMFVCICQ